MRLNVKKPEKVRTFTTLAFRDMAVLALLTKTLCRQLLRDAQRAILAL